MHCSKSSQQIKHDSAACAFYLFNDPFALAFFDAAKMFLIGKFKEREGKKKRKTNGEGGVHKVAESAKNERFTF